MRMIPFSHIKFTDLFLRYVVLSGSTTSRKSKNTLLSISTTRLAHLQDMRFELRLEHSGLTWHMSDKDLTLYN